ncbi:two-component system LytT family sensor kinase [Paenibacillus forsythiae]|uniref:Two-component system LytT family sensor kinase n=1 Tax=Paenibacillus forsythiae TaxID=365616 RepID=A0ABU3HBM4_9BACL|nr:sensor histidine kinase [Paenibacillus forsythiae]MDT3428208.1 two-component system LytT family sensor kinase [Paenibacillus forsythiae]
MQYTFVILLQLLERAALLLMTLFVLTRVPRFKEIFQKRAYTPQELLIATVIFSLFAIFSTYSGIKVEGSLVNVRIVAIMSGGILFGPWVGLITGLISGIHRFLIDIGGVTSVPCLITSIATGVVSGIIYRRTSAERRWKAGILAGMGCEALTMLLILVMAHPASLGVQIVSKIAFPMIVSQVSVGLIVMLVQSVEGEKERIAARQSKLALDIANKTLPYFRSINPQSLRKICTIIKEDIGADAVAITDTRWIRAYVGIGEEYYAEKNEIISEETKITLSSGEITIRNSDTDYNEQHIKSLIIIPLKEKGVVTGALKIYYTKAHKITYSLQAMAIGLSQMISTLMEVSRVEDIKEMANKAELKALQTRINPHFLFNALNAIVSSIRIDPDKARELIINLSGYMRYNLELADKFIDIRKELQQVRHYVEIEKARFGRRLKVLYDIDDEAEVRIPSLIIQPLVENAIVHGILKGRGAGTVMISVKDRGDSVRIGIRDTGTGIGEETIRKVYDGSMPENKIGLFNVHQRVKLIYGEGLTITRLDKGTDITFDVKKESR